MNTTDSIGRRSFVRGTVLALAAGTIPATAAGITVSALSQLIARHDEALAHRNQCLEAVFSIDDRPDYPEYPSVQVGRIHETHEPVLVSSEQEIVACAPPAMFFGKNGEQLRADWIASKVALLREAQERYEEVMISIGARAADDRYQEACIAEEDARLAIVLHQPSNDAEVRERAAYLGACEPFVEGWCEEESFQEKLYAALGIPIVDGSRLSLKAVL